MDVGPDFGLPSFFVSGGFSAGRTARVQRNGRDFQPDRSGSGEFDEDTAHFFDLFVGAEEMLVAQEISKTEFSSLKLGFIARVKWAVLRPQLLGRVACHPKRFFVRHRWFRPGLRSRLVAAEPATDDGAILRPETGSDKILTSNDLCANDYSISTSPQKTFAESRRGVRRNNAPRFVGEESTAQDSAHQVGYSNRRRPPG